MNITADLIQIERLEFQKIKFVFTYCDWAFHHLDIRFIKQDLLGSSTESFDFCLLDVLTPLQLHDPSVDVECSTSFALRHYS